jgi:UDP-N-acetylglucosamine--N-acetylmuramyl-(pentapeptide) pyrophosphoryl-undecaprenol N-acetylglucosamine transferase
MIQVSTTSFVLAGGGNPGLLLAGLAIADELRAIIPHSRFLFAGAGMAEECRRICQAGHEYVALGNPPESRRSRFWRWPWTRWGEERQLLQRARPAVVISLGGEIGEAVGRAASVLGQPLVVLEQHLTLSRATRRLADKARVICLGFEETRAQLRADCPVRVTGIPLAGPARSAVEGAALAFGAAAVAMAPGGRLVILGDGGPRRELNDALPRALGRLQPHLPPWRIVHRTHRGDVRSVQRLYRRLGMDAIATGHIHNLSALLARSDLVIAATPPTDVVKLAALATPIVAAIGGGDPQSAQIRAARSLAQQGACVVVDEPDEESQWAQVLTPLLRDQAPRQQLSAAMQRQLRTDAAWQIASIIRDIVSSPIASRVA